LKPVYWNLDPRDAFQEDRSQISSSLDLVISCKSFFIFVNPPAVDAVIRAKGALAMSTWYQYLDLLVSAASMLFIRIFGN
jgi:hypothetical protein